VVLRWIAVTSIALVSLLAATTILIAYSQVGSVDDARSYQYRYRPLRMGTYIEIVHNGTILGYCSLGFPAYYDSPLYPGSSIRVVVYGVITASHCGYAGDSVYQNVTVSNNYIGSMRDEGRFTYRTTIYNSNDVDATFVIVERYTYFSGSPRPPPQIVSAYIHHLGVVIPIAGYISSEEQLWTARNTNLIIRFAGTTTGYEEGNIRFCETSPRNQVACNNPVFGWIFIATTYGAGGDSGGPAYAYYTELRRGYAWVYGTRVGGINQPGYQWGETIVECTTSNGVQLCRPRAYTILYNVTTLREVVPLTAG
jgi:hypothetical protein